MTVRTWWFVHLDILYMLWLNFILGLHFIFPCFKLIIIHYHTPKQRKIKFKPRIKLNHNIYIKKREKKNRQSKRVSAFLPEWLIFLHRKSLLFEWEPVEWIFIFHVLCDRFKRIFFCWNNNKNRGDNIPERFLFPLSVQNALPLITRTDDRHGLSVIKTSLLVVFLSSNYRYVFAISLRADDN